jgi:hypothetical protein
MSGFSLNKTAAFAVLEAPGVKQAKAPSAKAAAAPAPGGAPEIDESTLYKSTLSVDEKVAIATSVGEEVLMPEELKILFGAKEHPIVYDGFEPSGRMVRVLLCCALAVHCIITSFIVSFLDTYIL